MKRILSFFIAVLFAGTAFGQDFFFSKIETNGLQTNIDYNATVRPTSGYVDTGLTAVLNTNSNSPAGIALNFNKATYIKAWVDITPILAPGDPAWSIPFQIEPYDSSDPGSSALASTLHQSSTYSIQFSSLASLFAKIPSSALPLTVTIRIAASTSSDEPTPTMATNDPSVEVVDFQVTVTDAPLATNEVDFKGFQFAPNPVKNQMNLKASSKIQKVEFYNMNGQKVLEVKPDNSASQVGTTSLAKGVYLMKVTINGSEKTYKVVKE